MDFPAIARQFVGGIVDIAPLGNGHINDTYLVMTEALPFVLQRINPQVFPQPEQIMLNLEQLNAHIARSRQAQVGLQLPKLIKTIGGLDFFCDEQGAVWRALSYIENSESLETLVSLHQAQQVGAALGRFHCLAQGLAADALHDTLPGFHVAPDYFRDYRRIAASSPIAADAECADFISRHQGLINELEDAKANGLLGLRVIHGDPKLNNFLFDKTSGNIVSLIDLDTVKPGLIHYDIGDCIRSCCHVPDDNSFSLGFCEAILASYLDVTRSFLTAADFQYLYPAIRLIPLELGIRFYADYLDGNRYFKVGNPSENVQRARAQFQLCADILRQAGAIERLIVQLQGGSRT